MNLPESYSALYPGRFLKADLFLGKKITLTIKNINIEELAGEKGSESKVVVSFTERPLEYVMPKTCGFALKRMFGNNPRLWVGKRVTWYPTTTKFGKDTVDCIRVWGSPDISTDMHITIPQGRKKPLEAVMHKVNAGECGFKGDGAIQGSPENSPPEPQESSDAANPIEARFIRLGWDQVQRDAFNRKHLKSSDEDILAELDGLLEGE